MNVLNYGGGRQTVALCVLIAAGKIERPDRVVIADTGREKRSTWDYLEQITRPLMAKIDLEIEIAPRSLAYVDLYGHNGQLLLPVYTTTGKLSAYCSTEWKARVIGRYLSIPERGRTHWIGFAWDERRRIKGDAGRRYPLCELMLTKADCIKIILDAGLPLPVPSACWMCPNMSNEEWRYIRDNYPADFEQACQLDDELRQWDIDLGNGGVWLHPSRIPLAEADLDVDDRKFPARQCGLGLCMI